MKQKQKKLTLSAYLKALKPYFYSELFCNGKYKGYHIRGKAFKNAFRYNPTLLDARQDCIATIDLEIFAVVNNAYLRKTEKLIDASNYTFQGKTPLQFLNIVSRSVLTQSAPAMSLIKQKFRYSLPEKEAKTAELLVSALSKIEKEMLPDINKYMMNSLIDMFGVTLRDIDYNETSYLIDRVKQKKLSSLFALNIYPTGIVLKDGKKSSKTPAMYEILANNLTAYAKAHLDSRYDSSIAFFSSLYDELNSHFGPYPTSKESFLTNLHIIAAAAYAWLKDKKNINAVTNILNNESIIKIEPDSCPLMYFIRGIIYELLYDISEKTGMQQCAYVNCSKFYLPDGKSDFCSGKCRELYSSQQRYLRNRKNILPKARLRSAQLRKEIHEQRAHKPKREKLIIESRSLTAEKLISTK